MHSNPKLGPIQRQSAVARLLGDGAKGTTAGGPEQEEEGNEKAEATELPPIERRSYCILRGRFRTPEDLELIGRQGKRRLFDWDGLTGANLDDPGRLVLHVMRGSESYTVTICGRGLDQELKDGVKARRVAWVQELDELAAAAVAKADPTEPVVTGIHIVKGSVSSEW
jgi:hypothetical protein